jgi:hypothetical protein
MSSRLSVIFYILVCIELGLALAVLPWIPYGWLGLSLSDWSSNYFLVLAARKTGHYGLQSLVASGWVRGAVSGVGILNVAMGIWQIIHFRETVAALDSEHASVKSSRGTSAPRGTLNETQPVKADPLSDYPRRNR